MNAPRIVIPVSRGNRTYSDIASPLLAHHKHAFPSRNSQRSCLRGDVLVVQAVRVNLEPLREPVDNSNIDRAVCGIYQLHKVRLVVQAHARRYENTFMSPEVPKRDLPYEDSVDTRENTNFTSVPTLQEHAVKSVRSGQRKVNTGVTDTVDVERVRRESTSNETRYVSVRTNLVAQERRHHGKYWTRGSEIVRAVFKVHHPPDNGTFSKFYVVFIRKVRQIRQWIHHVEVGKRGGRFCELNAFGNCIFAARLGHCERRDSGLFEKCV